MRTPALLLLLVACKDDGSTPRNPSDTVPSADTDTTPEPPREPPARLDGDISASAAPARIDAPDGVQIFGTGFGAAGDVDADGVADLVVGSPSDTNARYFGELHGTMWLVPGAPHTGAVPTDAVALGSVHGTGVRDLVGWAVAPLGDWNDDGFADFALGSPGTLDTQGKVGVVYGPLAGDLRIDTVGARLLAPVGTSAGTSLTAGSDFTGDGEPDLVVASATSMEHGREEVWVIAEPVVGDADLDAVAAAHLTFPAAMHGTILAANAGDLDGDGHPTLAVSATWPNTVYLFDAPLTGEVIPADAAAALSVQEGLGTTVVPSDAGDSDGDGYAELPLGLQGANNATGAVLLLGQPVDPMGEVGAEAIATLHDDVAAGVGIDVAFVGDLDGDGLDDLAVGAIHDDFEGWTNGEGTRGVVYLLYGPIRGDVDLGDADARILGDGIDQAFYVGQVGDLDGDGFDDLAIGAPIANIRDGATGSLYLFLGATSP